MNIINLVCKKKPVGLTAIFYLQAVAF